jgi:hypothetical protein
MVEATCVPLVDDVSICCVGYGCLAPCRTLSSRCLEWQDDLGGWMVSLKYKSMDDLYGVMICDIDRDIYLSEL